VNVAVSQILLKAAPLVRLSIRAGEHERAALVEEL
jgi:hypothetical protein